MAIAGVGNCASALVQGIHYYQNTDSDQIHGLSYLDLGGYKISDIDFVAAFDVDVKKVGKDLSEAISSGLNDTRKFADVPKLDVEVLKGPVMDGFGKYLKEAITIAKNEPADVSQVLLNTKTDILINYLPVGSEEATRCYAEEALRANCAFVNCMPVFIASDLTWATRFEEKGVPVAGDDIQSQLGATVLHKTLMKLLTERGVSVDESYQLNIGGDTDFLNMLERKRLYSKEISKTSAVKAMVPYNFPVKIGPSDYIPFLHNQKICYIFVKGRYFGDSPLTIDVKLSVWDAPNSAGVVIDVIRCVKLAMDRGIGGPLTSISAWAFKHPPVHATASLAKQWVDEFIDGKRLR